MIDIQASQSDSNQLLRDHAQTTDLTDCCADESSAPDDVTSDDDMYLAYPLMPCDHRRKEKEGLVRVSKIIAMQQNEAYNKRESLGRA